MKKIIFIITILLVFIKVNAQPEPTASISAKASAQVIAVLTATETAQLNFGRFSPETQGGKIILTPDGNRSTQGTVVLGSGSHNSGTFYLTGEYEATFSIILPSTPALLTNTLNAKTMSVTDWQSIPSSGVGTGKLTGGSSTVQVGAILNVSDMNANPVGIYTGIYAITFSYN